MRDLQLVAGVDEAGRGPLAGPVIAAAVILDQTDMIAGLADSKTIPERRREQLAERIREKALAFSIGRAGHEEIDRLNILNATLLAMQRAIRGLGIKPDRVLVDGNRCPDTEYPVSAVIKGDRTEACISAASILAKVWRDREMRDMDRKYPGYGFARHKGYPTMQHIQALSENGLCPIHRRSFSPVQQSIYLPQRTQS